MVANFLTFPASGLTIWLTLGRAPPGLFDRMDWFARLNRTEWLYNGVSNYITRESIFSYNILKIIFAIFDYDYVSRGIL
jgi:hypothetical protein